MSATAPDSAPAPAELRGYAVCTTPRTGSNLLCDLLESTGRLGCPREYFNPNDLRPRGAVDYPDDPALQLGEVLARGATPNGVYGLKIFAYQVDVVKVVDWSEKLPNLSFAYLERDDMLGQAISLVRAEQTGHWRRRNEAAVTPQYDPAAIGRALRNAAMDHARWRFWFARTGIRPLRLRYEQIVADPQSAVDAVAALVGVTEPVPIRAEDATVRIQRDTLSEEWRERFVQEHGARSRF